MPTLALTLSEPLSAERRAPRVRDPQGRSGLVQAGAPSVCGQVEGPWVPVPAAPGTVCLWSGTTPQYYPSVEWGSQSFSPAAGEQALGSNRETEAAGKETEEELEPR